MLERTGQTEAGGGPRPARGPQPVRRDLRGHERRRHDGAGAGPRALLPEARAEDGHGRGPDRLPAPQRQADRARGRGRPPDQVRRLQRGRLPLARGRQAPRGDGEGRHRRPGGRARARALRVPHGRRLPLAALRLRAAARGRARAHRGGGPRRAALPRPGGTRHRPAEQAARLPAPGGGPRHGRRQHEARPARRPARLRHRRADPRGPRAHLDPAAHEQPEEDRRPRGLRPHGHRPGADRAPARRAQPGLPARQEGAPRPHAPPPGPRPGRGDDPRGARAGPRAGARGGARTRTARARRHAARGMPDVYAACVGRFYEDLAERLVEGARRVFEEAGATLEVHDVPGRVRAAARGALLRRHAAATRAWPASAR